MKLVVGLKAIPSTAIGARVVVKTFKNVTVKKIIYY